MNTAEPHRPYDHHCVELFERLSEYIDKELDTATRREIEAHIQACKPCQVCLGTLKQTVNLCKHLRRHRVPELISLRLKAAVHDFVNHRTDGP